MLAIFIKTIFVLDLRYPKKLQQKAK